MNPAELPVHAAPGVEVLDSSEADRLSPVLLRSARPLLGPIAEPEGGAQGVIVGKLLALAEDGVTPLVRFPGQAGTNAVFARTSVDLHGPHIGASVLLMFEQGDYDRPIVIGVLRGQAGWPLAERPAQVSVDVDGERMLVTAREQLVFRCGKASITLTKAGKVVINGTYVCTRSSGANQISGGSVHLN